MCTRERKHKACHRFATSVHLIVCVCENMYEPDEPYLAAVAVVSQHPCIFRDVSACCVRVQSGSEQRSQGTSYLFGIRSLQKGFGGVGWVASIRSLVRFSTTTV